MQSLKVRQIRLRESGRPARVSVGELGIGQDHPAEADEVDPAVADGPLGRQGQPLLEVRIARSDDGQPRVPGLEPGRRPEVPGHADQRVLGREIAVGRREGGRPDHVRVVIRAARPSSRAGRFRAPRGSRGSRRPRPGRSPGRCRRRRRRKGYNPSAAGSPVPSGPGRNGIRSKTLRRTPTSRPGTSERMPSTTSRRNRPRFSRLPPYLPGRSTAERNSWPR